MNEQQTSNRFCNRISLSSSDQWRSGEKEEESCFCIMTNCGKDLLTFFGDNIIHARLARATISYMLDLPELEVQSSFNNSCSNCFRSFAELASSNFTLVDEKSCGKEEGRKMRNVTVSQYVYFFLHHTSLFLHTNRRS
jgi:hypothetical protein